MATWDTILYLKTEKTEHFKPLINCSNGNYNHDAIFDDIKAFYEAGSLFVLSDILSLSGDEMFRILKEIKDLSPSIEARAYSLNMDDNQDNTYFYSPMGTTEIQIIESPEGEIEFLSKIREDEWPEEFTALYDCP